MDHHEVEAFLNSQTAIRNRWMQDGSKAEPVSNSMAEYAASLKRRKLIETKISPDIRLLLF